MIATGTVLQDRYKIADLLGKGGMGAVYQAVDLRFGSTVALKQTLVGGDELLKAFEREAQLLNKLRHAALPVVIDYFAEGDGQFLVMQYIPGDDLAALLAANGGAFPAEVVVRWGERLLDALDYLHTQEPPIIHRDIKPQNLKLTPRGEVILLDFGLSKTSAVAGLTKATTSVSVLGYTPQYAPFEQINGAGTDQRTDLYSLAATLYHLMTGVPPADALTRAQSVMNGQPDPLRPANDVNPAVPPAVASALRAAMAMNREARPATAAALRALLCAGEAPASAAGEFSSAPTVTPAAPSVGGQPAQLAATVTASPANVQTTPTLTGQVLSEKEPSRAAPEPARRAWLKPALAVAAALVVAVGGLAWWTQKEGEAAPAAAASPASPAPAAAPPRSKEMAPPEASFKFETVSLDGKGRVTQRQSRLGRYYVEDLGGGVSLDMVGLPAGKFTMGTVDESQSDYEDEHPAHEVTLKQFYMGKFEVTQEQWRAVAKLPKVSRELNPEPSKFKGDTLPVEGVSWDEAVEFCARLSRKAGRNYRLPSESEWEYAARAGTTTFFSFGETITAEHANYDGRSPYASAPQGEFRGATTPVGGLRVANAFGLYDIHGNVWEWCAGEYHENYQGAPTDGSPWVTRGDEKHRVVRGGAWDNFGIDCRSANRFSYSQDGHRANIGFRVVMSL